MELREGESVKPLELFFDLVFVLAFTQCTALMAGDPDWSGIGRGMLALAVIWWAWVCYAWLTSLVEPEEGPVRLVMLGAMAGLLDRRAVRPRGVRRPCPRLRHRLRRRAAGPHRALRDRQSRRPRPPPSVLGFAHHHRGGRAAGRRRRSLDGGVQAALWVARIVVDWGGALFGVEDGDWSPATSRNGTTS